MVELSDKEAHCVARLLQGAMFGKHNTMAGCAFCKYQCDKNSVYRQIQKKFEEETGVDLQDDLPTDVIYSDFPYKKFLKNSNVKLKSISEKYFRTFSNLWLF